MGPIIAKIELSVEGLGLIFPAAQQLNWVQEQTFLAKFFLSPTTVLLY